MDNLDTRSDLRIGVNVIKTITITLADKEYAEFEDMVGNDLDPDQP